jgi:hypothetical protein
MSKKRLSIWWMMGAVIVLVLAFSYLGAQGRTDLEPFAQCLKDKGAVFYGAFWCPHCHNQKAMFGTAAGMLPYVECSAPSGRVQLEVCKEKGVTGYPTWVFADGSRLEGEVKLETLAEKTGCQLPKEEPRS